MRTTMLGLLAASLLIAPRAAGQEITKKELDKTTAELTQTKDTLAATVTERDTAVKVAAETVA